ncbi:DHHC palmitoyltransferase-domain-containing protein [Sordaria sp. MPI-SDFR-AT-0083]|nr:DHHC palmitoyltransferase-domain-containing protein [Sordaria sp. MPI-SDFR-AT-0083]
MDATPYRTSSTSTALDPPSSLPPNMARRWARKLERYCCTCVTYFPLAFVYSITSWAVYVDVSLSTTPSGVTWLGKSYGFVAVILYLLANWCYTYAVFTSPGSTTNDHGYSTLPTQAPPTATSFTVKSNGEFRFCKKCQARKPDRAHHCSTCRRCVLKMDHHCPWLATCVGLRNHKAFLLFLSYTSIFCWVSFAGSGAWVWEEIMSNTTYVETLMPVNYIMLSVISGIIGIVLTAFCGWHIYLASRGQTTIECLEKTRYLSPLRESMQRTYVNQHTPGQGVALPKYGQQLLDIHQNAIPGVTRPEEGEELRRITTPSGSSPQNDTTAQHNPELQAGSRRFTYDEMERIRARKRYEEYLDEQDSTKLPHAFDLGWRRNLLHLFGTSAWLWPFPVCTTLGDGWSWEPNPKWLEARDRIAREREEQRQRERQAGWGPADNDDITPVYTPTYQQQQQQQQQLQGGASRHYLSPSQQQPQTQRSNACSTSPSFTPSRRAPSKADRILGRDPNMYVDDEPVIYGKHDVAMSRLSPAGRTLLVEDEVDLDDDDDDDYFQDAGRKQEEAEQNALNVVTNGRWGRSAGASASGVGLLAHGRPGGSRSPISPISPQGGFGGGGHAGEARNGNGERRSNDDGVD